MVYLIIFLIGFIAGGMAIMGIALVEMASDQKRGVAGVDKWIPIKDELPMDGEEVLVSLTPNGVHGKKVEIDCFMMSDIKYWQSGKVEAWQPKPEPYKGESEDEK